MRVLFCGGGTAGHVNPAIAVAETVMRNSINNRIAYVTTENGIENTLVNFKKFSIDVIGLKRSLSPKNLVFLYKQIKAIERCKEIIREFRPDIIFGTGGYATFPVISAGSKLGVKTVLHESNVIPGKAILSLEKRADKIFVNFEKTKDYFKNKEKVVRTGNPLRSGFIVSTKAQARQLLNVSQKYVILCMGGSLGAEKINSSTMELVENLICHRKDILLIWSTGKNEFTKVAAELKKKGLHKLQNVIIRDYFENMHLQMAVADIVISRAGAMTISELAFMKKASIIVPSPNVTNNHQYLNAKALSDTLAAILITEDRLYSLTDTVRDLINNAEKRARLEKNIAEFSVKDVNKEVFQQLLSLL